MTTKPVPAAAPRFQAALQHYEAGRFEQADRECRELLAARPDDAHALHLRGVIALCADDPAAAAERIEQALGIDPSPPEFQNNLGEAYRALERFSEAEQAFRRALAAQPNYAAARSNLGLALVALGRFDEAEQCYRQALEDDPALASAQLNWGLLCLLRGDLVRGFALYESRYAGADRRQIGPARALLATAGSLPAWKGDDLTDKRLLVWTEQGFGDSLMMLRYLPLLEARGVARLVVYCDAALVRLVGAMPCVDEAVSQSAPMPCQGIDLHCSLMSLPHLLRTRLETVPNDFPYLEVPASIARKWATRLEGIAPPRVGLVWAGGQRSRAEARRSMHGDDLAPLRAVAGVAFVSLQKEAGSGDLASCEWALFDAMDECADFLDTAGLVQQMDLVISVDTAVAHLAGALGKETWLLNRHRGAWQWMLDGEHSPWYPRTRIFRQGASGDWNAVIQRVVAALQAAYPKQEGVRTAGRRKDRSPWSGWLRKLGK